MTDASKLLALAAGEIGTKEAPANSNNVKYNTWYYGKKVSGSSYPWCVAFQCWLFSQLGRPDLFYGGGKTASCGELKTYAQKHGQWVTKDYRPGDLVMFNFSGGTAPKHVGLCESWNGKTVVTIDGNTSSDDSGSQDNGGMVNRRARDKSVIVGAYRPNYDSAAQAASSTVSTVSVRAPILKKGVVHPSVRVLQAFLNASGCSCGEVDGSFGAKTDAAFRAWQKANGLNADGSCGALSWAKILGA